ncbi:MAG: tyrosinase family protein [Acidobacteriota bacterium]
MMDDGKSIFGLSRRQFVVGASALAAASSLPGRAAFGASSKSTASYLRRNVENSSTQQTLENYGKAVTAMLKLPGTDPSNWYRQALVHTLDCPHGNWWFLPWHRGYLGWFEEICRKQSGDPAFALPFWDWTAQPYVPPAFIGTALDPTTSIFVDGFDQFTQQYKAPFQAYFESLGAAQRAELTVRGYPTFDSLWSGLESFFFPRSQARANLTFDAPTRQAVSLPTVCSALAPQDFITFGSQPVPQHSGSGGFGILEGQPHNQVHNRVGGFMGEFLSPVDPIFFGHHGNIDRLWDVWTTKQEAAGLPTVPSADEGYQRWVDEPFLFYFDANGQPVAGAKAKAGAYVTIGDFDYSYEPGSATGLDGCNFSSAAQDFGQLPEALMATKAVGLSNAARGRARVPAELVAAASEDQGPVLYAEIAIRPPSKDRDLRYHVLVNPPAEATAVDYESPYYAATLEFFGSPHHLKGPASFLVPLPNVLKKLRAAGELNPERPLDIHVVADHKGIAMKSMEATLESVKLGVF